MLLRVIDIFIVFVLFLLSNAVFGSVYSIILLFLAFMCDQVSCYCLLEVAASALDDFGFCNGPRTLYVGVFVLVLYQELAHAMRVQQNKRY